MATSTQRRNSWHKFAHALALAASCVVLAGLAAMNVGCDEVVDALVEPLTSTLNKTSSVDGSDLAGANDGSNGAGTSDVIRADFSQRDIVTSNMTIYSERGFVYNGVYGNSWLIPFNYGGFMGTFTAPSSGAYNLTVTHLTSLVRGARGDGYSPVTISVNMQDVAKSYDPASNHGGTHDWVTDTFPITVSAGTNYIAWSTVNAVSKYWIHSIDITPQ